MTEEGRTRFRKYVAAIMAAGTIGATVYGYLSGLIPAEGGIFAGVLLGLAAKYLWEEQGK